MITVNLSGLGSGRLRAFSVGDSIMPICLSMLRRSGALILALCLCSVALPAVADAGLGGQVDDCATLRSLYQGLPDSEDYQEARRHLAMALVAMPGCIRAEGRLQRARTLDGVSVFTPGRLGGGTGESR